MRFIVISVGIAVVAAIVTFFLHKIKIHWIKYIPALLLFVITVLMIIMAQGSSGEGMQELAWVVMAILSFAGAVGSGITAIVLDVMKRKQS